MPTRRTLIACATALSAAVGAGCGLESPRAGAPQTTTAPSRTTTSAAAPPAFRGEAARVAHAIGALGRALRDGEVERLCRGGTIFTDAVVDQMTGGELSCEASVEQTLTAQPAPRIAVVAISVEPGLATARVRVRGRTVPLTLLRDGRRWLVSFSDGGDPLAALTTT